MVLQALDSTALYVMMTAGLIFALVGLYLIAKRKDSENAARIELFGLKFQSSSVGTLVFLVGAALLVVPMFVPKAPQSEEADAPHDLVAIAPAPVDGDSDNKALLLPASANAPESEPNNEITEVNQFGVGFGVRGTLNMDRDDFEDWYVVDLRGSESEDFIIQVRNLAGGCRFVVFGPDEEQLDYAYCNSSGGSRNLSVFAPESDRLFVRVTFNGGSAARKSEYELFVREGK